MGVLGMHLMLILKVPKGLLKFYFLPRDAILNVIMCSHLQMPTTCTIDCLLSSVAKCAMLVDILLQHILVLH
jgi:hypothetical protein